MSGVSRAFRKDFNRASPERQEELLRFAASVTDATPADMIVRSIHALLNAKRIVRVKREGPKVDATGRPNEMVGEMETIEETDHAAVNNGLKHALEWRQFVSAYEIGKPIERQILISDPTMTPEQNDNAHMEKLRGSPVYLKHVLELALAVAMETDEGRETVNEIIERIDGAA